jgi:hypothetical protein
MGILVFKIVRRLPGPIRDAFIGSDPRIQAARWLGGLNRPDAATALVRSLLDRDAGVRNQVVASLRHISWSPADARETADWVIATADWNQAAAIGPAAVLPLLALSLEADLETMPADLLSTLARQDRAAASLALTGILLAAETRLAHGSPPVVRTERDIPALARYDDLVLKRKRLLARAVWACQTEERPDVARGLLPRLFAELDSLPPCDCNACRLVVENAVGPTGSSEALRRSRDWRPIDLAELVLYLLFRAEALEFDIVNETCQAAGHSTEWSPATILVHGRSLRVLRLNHRLTVYRCGPSWYRATAGITPDINGDDGIPVERAYALAAGVSRASSVHEYLRELGLADVVLEAGPRRVTRRRGGAEQPIDPALDALNAYPSSQFDQAWRDAAHSLQKDAGLGAVQLAWLLHELVACRSPLAATALELAGGFDSAPELHRILAETGHEATRNSLVRVPRFCRWRPELWTFQDSTIQLGWSAGTAGRIAQTVEKILA